MDARAEDYRRRGLACMEMAQQVSDPENRAAWQKLANAWLRLAQQVTALSEPPNRD
jgi:hypothetical protein